MSRSLFFWIGLAASILVGVYGFFYLNDPIIYVPYGLITPLTFIFLTSPRVFAPIRRKLELLGALIIFINIPGSLYLHGLPIQYDIPLHFFMSWIVFEGLYLTFPIIFKKKVGYPVLVGAVFLGGLLYEGLQNSVDLIFGTNLATDLTQTKLVDFWVDIAVNAMGAIFGVFAKKISKPASSQSGPASPDHDGQNRNS
jgi:hypothetical protein